MNTDNLVESTVTLPALEGEFACWLTEPRTYWNGFDCPLFDRTQLETLIEALEAAGAEVEENVNQHTVTVDFSGDTETADEVRTHEGPMWALGAMGWCWSEVKRRAADTAEKKHALVAPRFVWLVGAVREEYPDVPEPMDDGSLVLWDRLHGAAVVTVAPEYAQALCLETTRQPGDAPFTQLASWMNDLTDEAMNSEGLPT